MAEDVFVELKTIQILGIGHSVIRGLVTTRSMVRREPYCLKARIMINHVARVSA